MDALRRTEGDNKQLSTRLDRTRNHKDKMEHMYIANRLKDSTFEEKRRTVETLSEEVERMRSEKAQLEGEKEERDMVSLSSFSVCLCVCVLCVFVCACVCARVLFFILPNPCHRKSAPCERRCAALT